MRARRARIKRDGAVWSPRPSVGQQRRASGTVFAEHGPFYDGTRTSFGYSSARVKFSPHFAVEPGISINRVRLPYGNFTSKLVTARLWACATVAVILLSFSIAASLGGAYVYNVLVQGVSTGAYLDGLTGLTVVADVVQAVIKAFVFGVLAGMVACYKGLTVERSPQSVGEAVTRQVITCFMLLFVVNLVISNLYFALVPAR